MDAVTQLQLYVGSVADIMGTMMTYIEKNGRLTPAQARALVCLADSGSTGPVMRLATGALVQPIPLEGVEPFLKFASELSELATQFGDHSAAIDTLISQLPATFPTQEEIVAQLQAEKTAGEAAAARLRRAEKRAQYYQGLLRDKTNAVANDLWALQPPTPAAAAAAGPANTSMEPTAAIDAPCAAAAPLS
jgi:hypothetical protein